MIHGYKTKKLGRNNAHRGLLVRNLLKSIIINEKIDTTKDKAKVVKSELDKIFTNSKKSDKEFAFRLVNHLLNDENLSKKVFEYYLPKLQDRNSGYSRRVILRNRPGDNATIVRLNIIGFGELKEKIIKSKRLKQSKQKEKKTKIVEKKDKEENIKKKEEKNN